MSDLRGANIRIKVFKQDEYESANEFLLEYNDCIIDIQYINDNIIITYEEVNKYFMLYYVNNKHKVRFRYATTGETLGRAIDRLHNFIEGADETEYIVSGKEITREQYKELKMPSKK